MTESQGGTQTRVLVVDDEPNIAQLVAMALGYEGFAVETAADGRGALAAVRTFGPHLVVLDVMLPDLDGFEVARRLRGAAEPVPVLFLTARDSVEDRVEGLTGGGDEHSGGNERQTAAAVAFGKLMKFEHVGQQTSRPRAGPQRWLRVTRESRDFPSRSSLVGRQWSRG